jgi:hypothetical protein
MPPRANTNNARRTAANGQNNNGRNNGQNNNGRNNGRNGQQQGNANGKKGATAKRSAASNPFSDMRDAAQGNTGVRAMKQVQWNALSYADSDKTLAFNAAEKAVQPAINELMKDFNRVVSDVSAKREVLISRPRGTPAYADLSAELSRIEQGLQDVSAQINAVMSSLTSARTAFAARPETVENVREYNAIVSRTVDELMGIRMISLARLIARSSMPVESGSLVASVDVVRVAETTLFDNEASVADSVAKRYENLVRQAMSLDKKISLPGGYKENFEAAVSSYRAAKVS